MKVLTTILTIILGAGMIGGGLVVGIFFICIFGIIGMFVWPYTINSWLIYYGKVAQVVWWHGFLLGFIPKLGILGIVLAVFTWIAMMFLK
jgi:hypothetical protein